MFQDDENLFWVFENIEELDNIRVLANLKHLNLSLLELQFMGLHVLLFDALDGYLYTTLLVDGQLNEPKLTLTESVLDLVEILYTRVSDRTLDHFNPLVSLLFGL